MAMIRLTLETGIFNMTYKELEFIAGNNEETDEYILGKFTIKR